MRNCNLEGREGYDTVLWFVQPCGGSRLFLKPFLKNNTWRGWRNGMAPKRMGK